jgi:hypothetical protein
MKRRTLKIAILAMSALTISISPLAACPDSVSGTYISSCSGCNIVTDPGSPKPCNHLVCAVCQSDGSSMSAPDVNMLRDRFGQSCYPNGPVSNPHGAGLRCGDF